MSVNFFTLRIVKHEAFSKEWWSPMTLVSTAGCTSTIPVLRDQLETWTQNGRFGSLSGSATFRCRFRAVYSGPNDRVV